MADRSNSRLGEQDSTNTVSQSSNLPKRPLTKPIAPRASTLTRPTSTSAAKITPSSAGTSLSKPPSRPSSIAVKKSPSIGGTSSLGHYKTVSVNSLDDKLSEDEKNNGIAARPKRISATSSSSVERLSTTKTTPASPLRRTAASSVTARPSTASPELRKAATSSIARSTSTTTAARSRPLSTSSLRNAGALPDRKRLSTIPASPAVKPGKAEPEENKENSSEHASAAHESAQSDTEQSQYTKNGERLSDVQSTNSQHDESEIAELRAHLAESQAQVDQLRSELDAVSAIMEEYSQKVNEESTKVDSKTEAIKQEHSSKLEAMLAAHMEELVQARESGQAEIEDLKAAHLSELESARSERSEIDQISALEMRYTKEISALQDQLAQSQNGLSQKQSELDKISDEITRQGQVISSLKEESVNFQQKVKEINEKDAKIKTLQDQISRLENSTQDENTKAANEAQIQEQASNAEIATLQKQLAEVQKELAQSSDTSKSLLQETSTKHDAELARLKAELEEAKSKHADEVKFLDEQLDLTKAELAGTNSSNNEILTALQAKVDDTQTALDNSTSKHQQEVDTSATKIASLQKELDELKTSHKHSMEILEAQQKAHTDEAVTKMEKMHAEKYRQLEMEQKSALRSLDDVEKTHAQQLKQVRDDAASAQAQVVYDLQNNHEKALSAVKKELEHTQQTFESAQGAHADQIKAIESKSGKDQSSALDALNSSHTVQLQKLKDELHAAHDRVLADLKVAHDAELKEQHVKAEEVQNTAVAELQAKLSEQTRQLESRSKSSSDELDAARFQTQSLKTVLQSLEQESKDKEESHQEEIDKLNAEIGTSVRRLAEQSSRMMQSQSQHDQAVTNLQTAFKAEKDAAIEAVQQQHQSALVELKSKLDDEHKAVLQSVKSEHEASLSSSRDSQVSHEKMVRYLQEEHTSKLAGAIEQLEQDHRKKFESLRAENLAAVEVLKTDHESALSNLRSDQHKTMEKLETDLGKAKAERAKAKDTLELDNARLSLSKAQKTIQDLSEQLQRATAETDAQRRLAEDANKEIEALKMQPDQHPEPTQEISASSTQPTEEIKSPVPDTPKSKNKKKRKSKSQTRKSTAGLESSMWAGNNENGTTNGEGVTSPADVPATPKLPQKAHTSKAKSTELASPLQEKRPNVAGQLAGIQESINQLNDISSDFLEEHERMAKTLSKVNGNQN